MEESLISKVVTNWGRSCAALVAGPMIQDNKILVIVQRDCFFKASEMRIEE